jgi:hypothetical protein
VFYDENVGSFTNRNGHYHDVQSRDCKDTTFTSRTSPFVYPNTGYTLWLFNIAMENPPFLIGKPSISMGHLYHGHVSHNQRVNGMFFDIWLAITTFDSCDFWDGHPQILCTRKLMKGMFNVQYNV